MTTTHGTVDRIASAELLESWEDRGCLMLRIRTREGNGEEIIRCNADAPGLGQLREAAERCLDAIGNDASELGAGD
jgi:hypothetical protein